MADMLVNLMDIPSCDERIAKLASKGINIRRAMTPDMMAVLDFVEKTTGRFAKGECMASFSHHPVSCYIAEKDGKLIGYACYDATMKDFFGPTEVLKEFQGHGIGAALLLKCLHSLKEEGYGYAVIGSVGPADFYRKVCNAVVIPSSEKKSIYDDFMQF